MPQPLPLSAEFESFVAPKDPSAAVQKYPWKMSRSSSGQSSVDYGNKTVITDPQAQQAITLDHIKKEALVVPLPPAPALPAGMIPGVPKAPLLQPPSPGTPPIDVKDLGKKMIAGHEADGKLYTFQVPQMSPLPGVSPPQKPQSSIGMPAQSGGIPVPSAPVPGSALAPGLPQISKVQLPHTVEVWTGSKLHLPLLTKSGSGSVQQTTTCKQVTVGEPPISAFQIPPGYKIVHPPSMPQVSMPQVSMPIRKE